MSSIQQQFYTSRTLKSMDSNATLVDSDSELDYLSDSLVYDAEDMKGVGDFSSASELTEKPVVEEGSEVKLEEEFRAQELFRSDSLETTVFSLAPLSSSSSLSSARSSSSSNLSVRRERRRKFQEGIASGMVLLEDILIEAALERYDMAESLLETLKLGSSCDSLASSQY
jgi:hypothetical protein